MSNKFFQEGKYYFNRSDIQLYILKIFESLEPFAICVRYSPYHNVYSLETWLISNLIEYEFQESELDFMDNISPEKLKQ